jgi:surface polysaccharide O-acyltransferase-like enzyme
MNNKIEATKLNRKDAYWQYVRGICMICVVTIHCKTGIGYENKYSGSWNFDYWFPLQQLINFPVAIFAFLAAYLTNIETVKRFNKPYKTRRETHSTISDMVNHLHNDSSCTVSC